MPLDVVRGSMAVFACKVTGTAPFEITWFKDNKQITSSTKHIITHADDVMRLEIRDCDLLDVGSYQCMLANEVGSCTGSAAMSMKGWLLLL